jgi:hypothetical protein
MLQTPAMQASPRAQSARAVHDSPALPSSRALIPASPLDTLSEFLQAAAEVRSNATAKK